MDGRRIMSSAQTSESATSLLIDHERRGRPGSPGSVQSVCPKRSYHIQVVILNLNISNDTSEVSYRQGVC